MHEVSCWGIGPVVRRTLVIVVSVALSLVPASPAQASEKLIKANLRTVRLTAGGSVQVSFEYRCPGDYDYEAMGFYGTRLTVSQMEASGHEVYRSRGFHGSVVCDGVTHTLIRSFRPPEGETFDPELLLTVELYLGVRSDSDPYPGQLGAAEIDTFSVAAHGGTTLAADIHIDRLRLNDRGKLVVVVSYECPAGWFVDVEDDSDWADISGGQNKPGMNDAMFWEPLGDDIVCDGGPHTIVKRVSDQMEGGFSPTLPIQVEAKMILEEMDGPRSTYSSDFAAVLFA